MSGEFQYDVFLSHSSKDTPIVLPLAERLRADGVRVWLDEWVLEPGAHISYEIQKGLKESRVLMLCMSANTFGSDWTELESHTFRFRDPLNKERRFFTVRLDDAPIDDALRPFKYVDWSSDQREEQYAKLLKACRSEVRQPVVEAALPKKEQPQRPAPVEGPSPSPEPPPSLAWQIATCALGLLMAFVIARFGLPLLHLVPKSLQDKLVAPSSALVGIIAVAAQFYGYRRWSNNELAPYFKRTLVMVVAAILLFLIVQSLTVVTIETTPGDSMSFVVGFTRPHRDPCPTGVSDEVCIGRLPANETEIKSFWGDGRIRLATIALKLSYLTATGALGALVGLLFLARRR